MGSRVIFVGWDRSVPGREAISGAHFQEFVEYLGGLQQAGTIQSFQGVLLDPHGGDLNGFFLLQGEVDQLAALSGTEEWANHTTRAGMHLEGFGVVWGVTGEALMQRMALWNAHIPQ